MAGESPISTETDLTPVSKQPASEEIATKDIERLQALLAAHERGLHAVPEDYEQLQAEHKRAEEADKAAKDQAFRYPVQVEHIHDDTHKGTCRSCQDEEAVSVDAA